jgi:5-methylcytosine-specific restriction endonuclease McrA
MKLKRQETRTYADRRDYIIKAVSKRRRAIKVLAIEYKGGRCQLCGYNKYQGSLDLHHLNPDDKGFSIGQYGHSRSWDRVKKELDKCILVCANCHREVEAGIISV